MNGLSILLNVLLLPVISNGIKIINIFLEDTAMTPGLELQIGNIFALMKYQMDDSEFYEKLYQSIEKTDNSNLEKPVKVAKKTNTKKPKKESSDKLLIGVISGIVCLGLFCGIWFLPAAMNAAESVTMSREDALKAAEACFEELVGKETAANFYVDYICQRLKHNGSVFKGVYIYDIEYQNQDGTEYKIEVNATSGETVVRDID